MRTVTAITLLFTLAISAFSVYAAGSRKPYYCHGAFRPMPYLSTGGVEARVDPLFKGDNRSAKRVRENTKNSLYQ